MRITSKGQVTIPAPIREAAGLLPNTDVEFVLEDDTVRIVKAAPGKDKPGRGEEILSRMQRSRTLGLSTDEIMAMTRGWGEDDPGFR